MNKGMAAPFKTINPLPNNTKIFVASENILAGRFVNKYVSNGIVYIRNADCTDNTKPAHGFVLNNVNSRTQGLVYYLGNDNTSIIGLTVGTVYYLSTTGIITSTVPSASGNLIQELGIADMVNILSTYFRTPVTLG